MALKQRDIALFRLALAIALIAIAWLATTPRQIPVVEDMNDKVNHVLAFVVLGLLADFAFPERGFDAWKFLPLLCYGALIEAAQSFLPFRDASLYDLAADAVGLVLYGCSVPALKTLPWLSRRWYPPPHASR